MEDINVPFKIQHKFETMSNKYKYQSFKKLSLKSTRWCKIIDDINVSKKIDALGNRIEFVLQNKTFMIPSVIDLYDMTTNHLNTSSLKSKNRFFKIMDIIRKKKKAVKEIPSTDCIEGTIHENIINQVCNYTNYLSQGKQKQMDIYNISKDPYIYEYLKKNKIPYYITGTCDFEFIDMNHIVKHVPIELKTIKNMTNQYYLQNKIKQYMTQLCMYQSLYNSDSIWLFMICRKTFKFTIIPLQTLSFFERIKYNFSIWCLSYILI